MRCDYAGDGMEFEYADPYPALVQASVLLRHISRRAPARYAEDARIGYVIAIYLPAILDTLTPAKNGA